MKGTYGLLAVLFGIGATIVAALSILVFENWLPASLVNNFSATELGAFSVLLFIAAGGAYYAGNEA